jgi:glycosyltransferase involved in cell wall biosynthesis
MMERICILVPSFSGGGAEKVAINLANYFASEDFNVDLVSLISVGPYRKQVLPIVKLVDINSTRSRYSVFALRKYLLKFKPSKVLSVIRSTNIILGLASLTVKNAPEIYFREASPMRDLILAHPLRRLITLGLMRLTYKRAKTIITNSIHTKNDLIQNGILEAKASTIIDNPVLPLNINSLIAEDVDHPWFINKSIKVILSVGRLAPEKDHLTIIKAFSIVAKYDKNVRLLILGEGSEETTLLKLIKKLALEDKVEIHEFVNNPFPYYKLSTVFAMTSQWEGFGNVIVESLSVGTPVVFSDCPGGPTRILEDGKYGKLVAPGNPQETADAISHVLKYPVDKHILIKRSEDFTVSKIGKLYAETMGLDFPSF